MLSSPALAAILRHLADEVEKVDAPPAPALPADVQAANAPPPAQPTPADVQAKTEAAAAAPAPPVSAPVLHPIVTPTAPATSTGLTQPKPVIDLSTIKGIQQAMNQIRAPNFPKLEENGIHDAVMTWDLKFFQATVGIPVTGNIDEITVNTIHKAIFGTPRA